MVYKLCFSGNIRNKPALSLIRLLCLQFTIFRHNGELRYKVMRISVIILVLLAILSRPAISQVDLSKVEMDLRSYADSIVRGSSEEVRSKAFSDFNDLMEKVMMTEGSFSYPFDSVPSLSKHTSADGRFRIYTWLMPSIELGRYLYTGIIQFGQTGKPHIRLTDVRDIYQDHESRAYSDGEWYGAVYYDMFSRKVKGQVSYYLLGWRGNDQFTTSKVIDVVTFDESGSPVLGSPVFLGPGEKVRHRVVFTFSAQAVMLLRYEERKKRIVFDHLSPAVDKAEGDHRYYGPDFTYDAFRYRRGVWQYREHLELRNRGN